MKFNDDVSKCISAVDYCIYVSLLMQLLSLFEFCHFYRTMHYSAKCGIASSNTVCVMFVQCH